VVRRRARPGSSDVWVSVASALIVELPLAFFMFNAARRLNPALRAGA